MYQILDQIEMIGTKRTVKGSRYFPDELKAVLDLIEVGQGTVVPFLEDTTKENQRMNVVYYTNKWAKTVGKEFVAGWTANGIGIKRVA